MSITHGDKQARRVQLSDLAGGYRASAAVLAGIELGVFNALNDGAKTMDELAAELSSSQRGMRGLLDALTGLDLLALEDGRYCLHGLADEFLRPADPDYLGDILEHNVSLFKRWSRLADTVRSGVPIRPPAGQPRRSPRELRAFIMGMHNISVKSAEKVAEFLDLENIHTILDLAGGPGTCLHTLLRHAPHARGAILDLPPVIEIAREQTEKSGLASRVEFISGDFFDVDFAGPWDLILISNIIHSLDETANQRLINRSAAALAPGGQLLIKDFFLDETRTTPSDASLFTLNMLVGTETGRSFSWSEAENWLEMGGLKLIRRGRVGISSGLLLARKP